MVVPVIIDGRWTKTKDYTATNGSLTSITTTGERALGDGRFYFELTTPGGSNRWIGVSSRANPSWQSGGISGAYSTAWHTGAGVYGFELDLTSTTIGRIRSNLNGGAFGPWSDIKDTRGGILTTIMIAAGSAASANGQAAYTVNVGQSPFKYDYSKDDWNIQESIYSFDGSTILYDKARKSFIYSDGRYLKINPIDYSWEEVSSVLPTPDLFKSDGMSSFFLSNRLLVKPIYEMPKTQNLFMGNMFSRTIDLRKLVSIVNIK